MTESISVFRSNGKRTQSCQRERLNPWIRNVIKSIPPKIISLLSLRQWEFPIFQSQLHSLYDVEPARFFRIKREA